MRRSLPIAIAVLTLLAAGAARAGSGAREGAGSSSISDWDDSHMQSNFARQRGPAPPRPPVQGADRYREATEHPAPTPPTGVAETTLKINPHGWRPGGPTTASGAAPPWASARGRSSSGSARPTASAGVRTGSSLRRSASSGASR